MKLVLKILTLILLFNLQFAEAQYIPWTFQQTTVSDTIDIQPVGIESETNSSDTLILGVFYNSNSGPMCGGYAFLLPETRSLVVYGKDLYNDGFAINEPYQFRVYNLSKQCYEGHVKIQFPGAAFKDGNFIRIDTSTFKIEPSQVYFAQNQICQSVESVAPVIKDDYFSGFSSDSPGLEIDSSTGIVYPPLSTSGYYNLTIHSLSCLNQTKTSIEILPKPQIVLPEKKVDCGSSVILTATNPLDSGSVNTYTWSNGGYTNNIEVINRGKYWVEVKNSFGCTASDTTDVRIYKEGDAYLGKDTLVCSNASVILVPKVREGSSYSWSTGSTADSIVVTSSGSYWVKVNFEKTCVFADTINVNFSNPSIPDFDIGKDTIVCSPSLSLNAGNNGANYSWSTGATNQSLDVKSSGTYWVKVYDQGGCFKSDSITVNFVSSVQADISVEVNNPACISGGSITLKSPASVGNGPLTYTLLQGNNVINHNALGVFDGIEEGDYRFEIKDSNGCQIKGNTETVSLRKTEPCPDKVLVFGSSMDAFNPPSYYIGVPGETKIYDKAGVLIKSLIAPAEWDGRGTNGEVVPMGDYLIVFADNQRTIITVVK